MQALATTLDPVPTAVATPVRIITSLYGLVEAVNTEVSPEEDDLVAAAVMHLINSHRACFVGSRKTLTVVEA